MPEDDDGLPLPPAPQPHLAPIRRAPDLADGMVRNRLVQILRSADRDSGPSVFTAIPSTSATPKYLPFKGTGADPLTHIESALEEAVGSDPGLLGNVKALFAANMTPQGRPVAVITDLIRLWGIPGLFPGIDKMQSKFLTDHAADLINLGQQLGDAKKAMMQLSYYLDTFNLA